MKILERRERRNKLEIYCAILNSIIQESKNSGIVRPTRIQFSSGLSYDSLTKFLNELKEKKMLLDHDEIRLTKKGVQFLKDCEKIRKFTEKMGLDYL
ncbi:MAG: winged helix-turn-helix domain-containing protein [Nitrosotalea sp.]